MKPIDMNEVYKFVQENIGNFHKKRLKYLEDIKLQEILKRKNPYLFKAKHMVTVEEIVTALLDASLSSSEETIFGNFLESLAIFINRKVYGGRASGITGIDLEFEKADIRYIVSIKSGPNWGNSRQVKKMIDDFKQAKRVIDTHGIERIIAVNGCCYGMDNQPRS